MKIDQSERADRNPNEKNESNISDPWIKCADLRFTKYSRRRKGRRVESVFEEIMAKNPSNLKKRQISRYRKHKECSQTR